MKKSVFLFTCTALLMAGCAKEAKEIIEPEKAEPQEVKTYTITALTEDPSTRSTASLNEDKTVTYSWEENEQIAVVPVGQVATLPFTVVDPGQGTFRYSGTGTYDGFGLAVTPASALVDGASVGENTASFTIRFSGHYPVGHSNGIMVAGAPSTGTDNNPIFHFKHIAGLVKVTYKNVPAGTKKMVFSANDATICGDFSFNAVSGITATADNISGTTGTEAYVEFESATTAVQESVDFYLPIPIGTYSTFSVYLADNNGVQIEGTDKSWTASTPFQVTRCKVIRCPEITLTTDQLIPDGAYAIALMGEAHLENIMMTAAPGENHQTYSAIGADAINGDGIISVSPESAWRFAYNADHSTYTIMSMSANKYLEGYAGPNQSNLKLARQDSDKAEFFITSQGSDTQGNQLYQISVRDNSDVRWIGFNFNSNGTPLFGMYYRDAYPCNLCLIPASIIGQQPSITFDNEEVTVSANTTKTAFFYTAEHLLVNPAVVVNQTDDYRIISSAEVDATNHQVVVNLIPNEDDVAKTATLTVSCRGTRDITLTIHQNGKNDIVQDVLTKALIGVEGSSYENWTGVTYTNGSGAVYAGNSSGGGNDDNHNFIQLRATNSSGIVTTTSGGNVKTISVTWDESTPIGRTLNVYGKNTAYSASSDLYGSSTQGTLLGTIVCGTSTELAISNDYQYVGLKSNNNSMYLTEIKIDWKPNSGSGGGGDDTNDYTTVWTATSGALGSGIGSGTITSTVSGSSTSQEWSYTRTLISGSSYTGWGSECIQLGKNGGVENLTLSTSNIQGTIKSVSVECASYQGKHNVSITVGGTTYLASTATSSWTTVEAKTGTGSSSGQIVISFTDGTRALYIKSITVVYNN